MAEDWFVVNVADADWATTDGGEKRSSGSDTSFERDGVEFEQLGVRIHVLAPGEPNGFYHEEDQQEDFLVLAGECLLIVEGEERRLKQWDFFHSPAGTGHIFVGAGDGPCAIFMVGARSEDWNVRYPVWNSPRATAQAPLRRRRARRRRTSTSSRAAAVGLPPGPTCPGRNGRYNFGSNTTYGGDLVSTWSIHPDELQAEVAGRPRKSTGTNQMRRTISHSLPNSG